MQESSANVVARLRSVNDENSVMEDNGKQVFLDTTAPRFSSESKLSNALRFVHLFKLSTCHKKRR